MKKNKENGAAFEGIGVSRGLAQGRLLRYAPAALKIPEEAAQDAAQEAERFRAGVEALRLDLLRRAEKARAEENALQTEILEAHLEILEDEDSLLQPILEKIRGESMNAAAAAKAQMDEIIALFSGLEDEYLRQRAADFRDLQEQLLREILGERRADFSQLPFPAVIVAEDLAPSDTISLDRSQVLGIVCEKGGKTSHTAVLANAMGIPAVMGCRGILEAARQAETIQVDGDRGEVFLDPDETARRTFAARIETRRAQEERLRPFIDRPTRTKDGKRLLIFANIASPEESRLARENGCEGVGLFRSEFLYYQNPDAVPNEATQRKAYEQALRFAQGRPVTVRTLDAGGDKPIAALHMPAEANPFLGCRAIRVCLREKEMFRTQLRALLLAGAHGPLRIMFPMIAGLSEFRAAKAQLLRARDELAARGEKVSDEIELGLMIEIPSAVAMADELAKEADFFSIGTNDLTQYTLAADRGNEAVSNLYSYYDPAVIRMTAHAIRAAHRGGIPCGMCGEAACDTLYAPLLVGLGLDEFSVAPRYILTLRETIGRLESGACEALAQQALRQETKENVISLLQNFVSEK